MSEPTIFCPNCKSEIKLTESLAAPLMESMRRDFDDRLARKDADVAKREQTLKDRENALSKAKDTIDQQVAEQLKTERTRIASEEAKKAKLVLGADIEQQAKEIAELQEVLKSRDDKLAEAQKAQAELVRKQRELDDAKREMELTIERRLQASLSAARDQTKREVEEQLSGQVNERNQTIAAMEKQIGTLTAREQTIRDREAALSTEKDNLEAQITQKLAQERSKIVADESKKAMLLLATDMEQKAKEIADLQEVLKQREGKLAAAQEAQAELVRKQRALDDAKREMDLTIENRVQESLATTRDQAKREAEEKLSLKVMEKEQTIAAMSKQIEELKRKADQGSQQLQGEVQELQLESLLRAKFPIDKIDPVPKGEHGGDILHRIVMPNGVSCGTILWESKRTKTWGNGWLPKLREDQRAAKAEIAVLVSAMLPDGVETFDQVDGVWVVHPRAIIPVALSLRQMLIEVNCARQTSEGQQTKMGLIYQYLTGPDFRSRVQAIVEAFSTMSEDLRKEERTIRKQWAKRGKQLDCVMQATVGMYGELQGIAGKSLQEIAGLDMKLLETADAT